MFSIENLFETVKNIFSRNVCQKKFHDKYFLRYWSQLRHLTVFQRKVKLF